MQLRLRWGLALCLVLVNAGCNAILGNEPHEWAGPPDSTTEGGGSAANAVDAEAAPRTVDAAYVAPADAAYVAPSDAAPVAPARDASDAASCASPALLCGTACVPSDVHNCAACGNDCTNLPHVSGAASCTAGACAFAASSCAPGWMDCNGNPADGCETDISQAATCGGCKTACSGATAVCSASGSTYACASACPAATPTSCGMTCVSTASSAGNCGSCGNACTTTIAHAQAACSSGACTSTCNAGYMLCNGACVNVTSDTGNCGSCGNDCSSLAHVDGAASCSAGACAFAPSSCAPGWMDCDGNQANGCETDISQGATCGGCKTACSGATPVCSGSGSTFACASGCLAATPTLCGATCVNTASSTTNCSECGKACTTMVGNAQAACSGGACTFTCNQGYTLCNGACVNEQSDPNNCGGCGGSCKGLPHVSGTATCGAGACSFAASACAAGWMNCNGLAADGCETDISQAATCGGCTTACSGGTPVCSGSGSTYSCVSGCLASTPTLCGSSCVNTMTSLANCGGCGVPCSTSVAFAQAACVAGACGFTCNTGYSQCSGACVDELTNTSNCGACGVACAGGTTCQNGKCLCLAGAHSCSGTCESNMGLTSCGTACDSACPGPTNGSSYGSPTCNGTSCGVSCASGDTYCSATGACVNLQSDSNNCGSCGHVCAAGTTCESAGCVCNATSCPTGCCNGNACDAKPTYYLDHDTDGYGNPAVSVQACTQPAGYVTNNQDCCDSDDNAHPGSTYCSPSVRKCNDNSWDYNCDGQSAQVTCCQNVDGDCSDGWINPTALGTPGACTPNTVTTGTPVDCGNALSCTYTAATATMLAGCTGTCVGGTATAVCEAAGCEWLASAPCGTATTEIDFWSCNPADCTVASVPELSDTGYSQGCQ